MNYRVKGFRSFRVSKDVKELRGRWLVEGLKYGGGCVTGSLPPDQKLLDKIIKGYDEKIPHLPTGN